MPIPSDHSLGGGRPPAGLKPVADQIRRMPPFGSPKRGRVARPNDAKRRRRRVVQVDPPHGGTDARFPRQGRWRGSVAAPASWVHGRPGIAGLHPAGGRASRGPLKSATGLSDAAKAGEPAYPLGPRFAGPRQGLARDCAPSIPQVGPRSVAACVFAQRLTGFDSCRCAQPAGCARKVCSR